VGWRVDQTSPSPQYDCEQSESLVPIVLGENDYDQNQAHRQYVDSDLAACAAHYSLSDFDSITVKHSMMSGVFMDAMPLSSEHAAVLPDSSKRGMLIRILEPALQLWLRSQVESAETIKVHLSGGDRQVLSGYIPQVELEAHQAIYQGLHLSHVQLTGKDIRVNIGQVLKGKALQPLNPIPVEVKVQIETADLEASLESALFQQVLIEILLALLGDQIEDALGGELRSQSLVLQNPHLLLGEDRLRLSAQLTVQDSNHSIPVSFQTGLVLGSPSTLVLQNPEWLPTPNAKRGLPLPELQGYCFDLGDQAQFQDLSIAPNGIQVCGQLLIVPTKTT
jgi:LmeA-like phospholipid-binding